MKAVEAPRGDIEKKRIELLAKPVEVLVGQKIAGIKRGHFVKDELVAFTLSLGNGVELDVHMTAQKILRGDAEKNQADLAKLGEAFTGQEVTGIKRGHYAREELVALTLALSNGEELDVHMTNIRLPQE
ncbi:MAG: hypothetical protein Q7S36_01610 [Candidatus Liptonbacteria bacterium]|nr:hypothetical protein [Candidatus Liptonbacteria bacterium]